MTDFLPHPLIRNRHVQSFLASSGLRRPLVRRRGADMLARAQPVILDAGAGVRLHGLHSVYPRTSPQAKRATVILIHGWEGSAESVYLMSAAAVLFNAGYDIFRLHLRDHGPTHHLNEGLFHAARLDEVVSAVREICARYVEGDTFLAGFSLGGNFAIRLAARAAVDGLPLTHVVAVSPAVVPRNAMAMMEFGPAVYHRYFVSKWQNSLNKKSDAFPGLLDIERVRKMRSLGEMTDYLVSSHTEFENADAYLASYEITPEILASIRCATDIITAQDDPVIPARDFSIVRNVGPVRLRVLAHGGHCGFVKNLRLHGWIDEELLRLFAR
ncbi:MAG: alpha/beta fold hydrolase [Hahellaceae bacterium]|nr:alpha/beta fold hydrolase [Hahellaceae bacterium]MCP5169761.1 alpha/beta fold hydrolase [Hahellaceae bacterium]